MSSRDEVTYKLVSLACGVLGGAVAGAVFTRFWRGISHGVAVPDPTALDRDIGDVLIVGALQGTVFGLVKALLSRITARGYRRFTGHDLQR